MKPFQKTSQQNNFAFKTRLVKEAIIYLVYDLANVLI